MRDTHGYILGYAIVSGRTSTIDWTGHTKPYLIFTNHEAAQNWLKKHSKTDRRISKVRFKPKFSPVEEAT
jgi:hypothetical protein